MNESSFRKVRGSFSKILDKKTGAELHDLKTTLAILLAFNDRQRELILNDIVLAESIKKDVDGKFQSIILGGGFDVQSGEEEIG